jgi:hypothetical protein
VEHPQLHLGWPADRAGRAARGCDRGAPARVWRPVELRGLWAVFAVDVPSGPQARVDARHRVTGDPIEIDCSIDETRDRAGRRRRATQLRLALDVAKIFGNEVGSATQ